MRHDQQNTYNAQQETDRKNGYEIDKGRLQNTHPDNFSNE